MKEFSESSKLFKPFYLVGLLPIMILMSFLLATEIKENDKVGIVCSALAILVNVGCALFLYSLNLELQIDDKGIQFCYKPFHRQFTIYQWNNIVAVEVVTISPVKDFGGWGKRRNRRLGEAYLSKGNKAIKITDSASKTTFISVIDEKTAAETVTYLWSTSRQQ